MKRFLALDVLRGVAALAVVGFHLGQTRLLETPLVPHGYLAVDFFFVLSGLVVGHAYEEKLLTGHLSKRSLLWIRFVRLYPMALFGALLGLVVLLLKWRLYPERVDPLPQILASGALNGLMLPTFFGGAASRYELFPGDGPLWSIFFEAAINLLWVVFAARLKTTALVAIVFVSAIFFVALALHFETAHIGFNIQTFFGGVARVTFGFTLGVVFSRLKWYDKMPTIPFGIVIPGTVLTMLLIIPHGIVIDLVSILIIMPAIVALGAAQTADDNTSHILGELSYPVYAIHFPILVIASGIYQTKLSYLSPHAVSFAAVIVCVVSSYLIMNYFDKPVRMMVLPPKRKEAGQQGEHH